MESVLSLRPSKVLLRTLAVTFAILFSSLLFLPRAHATVYYFVGGGVTSNNGRDNFATAGAWSGCPKGAFNTTCNSIAAAVPGAGDVAVFNYSGGTVKISAANTRVGSLIVANTWTGSIVVATGALRIVGTMRMGSGTFVGGSGFMNISGGVQSNFTTSGALVMTGGIIRNLMGNLDASGAIIVGSSTSTKKTSFTSTGTIIFSGNANQALNLERTSKSTISLRNLTLNNAGSAGANRVIVSGSGVSLSGALTVTNGVLEITKSSTPLNIGGTSSSGFGSLFTIASTSTAGFTTGNNVTISGSLTIGANASWTATGGTTTFNGDNPQTLTLNGGGRRFQNLTLNNSGSGDQNRIIAAGTQNSVASGLSVSGTLTVTLGQLDLMTNNEPLALWSNATLASSTSVKVKTKDNITLSGALTVGANATFTVTGGTLTLRNVVPQTLTFNNSNQRFNNLTVANGGSTVSTNKVTFNGNAFSLSGTLTITTGNVSNTAGLQVRKNITLANSAVARYMGGGDLALSGSLTVNPLSNFTMTSGTLTLNGTTQTLSGTLKLNNLTKNVTTADTMTIGAGNTYYLSGALTLNGAASNLLTVTSSSTSGGAQWNINVLGTNSVTRLALDNSNNISAGSLTCTNCTDNGHNTRWSFVTPSSSSTTSTSTGTSGGGGGGGGGRRSVSVGGTTTTTTTAPAVSPAVVKKNRSEAKMKALERTIASLQKRIDKATGAKKTALQKVLARQQKSLGKLKGSAK